jgi:hypothetical protein
LAELAARKAAKGEAFIGLGARSVQREAASLEKVHSFGQNSGAGEEAQEATKSSSPVAGLFQ